MKSWRAPRWRPERTLALLLGAAGLILATARMASEPQSVVPLGWAGADLGDARRVAWETGRPILVLVTKPECAPCEALERLLLEDDEIAPLCEPFLRVRLDVGDPRAATALAEFRPTELPVILLLGPAGREATRREGRIERAWLVEELLIVARRHAPAQDPPQPDPAALRASLIHLEDWGDVRGALRLRERLAEPQQAVAATRSPNAPLPDESTFAARFEAAGGPDAIVRLASELAMAFEAAGQPATGLHALQIAAGRLPETNALLEARAGFLAERHDIELEATRVRLLQARLSEPRSVPLLLALARVAEARERLYQALHALEAAAAYEPSDAWTALELQRVRLLVRLRLKDRGAPTPL